jgi:large subunit ribosomal protein L24e
MFRFCRSKCHKNFKAKRNPRRVRWTKAYRKTHGKELVTDPVLEFEKHRDTAVRYNRDVWVNTIQAMEKIDEIKQDREGRFWQERMKNAEHHKKEMIKSDLIKNQTLIGDVHIRQRVDELREKGQLKRQQAKQARLAKHKRFNVGLNDEMKVDGDKDVVVREKKKANSKRKAKKHVVQRKNKILNNNNIESD